LIYSKTDKKREKDECRKVIVMMLPSFLSQILLLMNSGALFEDAFLKISESYSNLDEKRKNIFTESICSICETSKRTGESIPYLFLSYSRTTGVKELNHAATLIAENVGRGTLLWERIADLSEEMWKEKKRMTIERIRLAESKMSFPLGLLLIALLIITVAPAIMQM